MPGGTPSNPKLAAFLPAFPATLRKQTQGRATTPRRAAILAAAVEGAQVDFDDRDPDRVALPHRAGHRPELQEHDPGVLLRPAGDQLRSLRPEGVDAVQATRLGVLGAGMMGAGIAYVRAPAPASRWCSRTSPSRPPRRARRYSATILDKAIAAAR